MKGKRHTVEEKVRILRKADKGKATILEVCREARGVKTIYIEPGCPWENPFVESLHGKFRRECLEREQLWSLSEARVVIEEANYWTQGGRANPAIWTLK